MKRETILIVLGVLALALPWSGIPLAWLGWLYLPLGLIVSFIGFTLRSRSVSAPALPEYEPTQVVPEPAPRATRMARF